MLQSKKHILIVDDDIKILQLLKLFFEQNNFLVSTALSTIEASILLQHTRFDLMILDIMLPEITGIEFAKTIKNSNHDVPPIMLLTALAEPEDCARGLAAGASDYLTKPFDPQDLLIRSQKLINTHNQYHTKSNIKYFGKNCYNLQTKELICGTRHIILNKKEQTLLSILIMHAGTPLSRNVLAINMKLEAVAIDIIIGNIREKIEDVPTKPQYLQTVPGIGYVFCS